MCIERFYPICTRKEVASTDTLQTNSTAQTAEMLKLEGVVEHVIYENPDTGYAVFEVDAGGTDIVVAGNVGSVDNGMSITPKPVRPACRRIPRLC